MKRQRTPAQKKALSYERDHILAVEHREGFNQRWARKKAKAQRKERRQVRSYLSHANHQQEEALLADVPLRPVRRDMVRKWPGTAVPLAHRIEQRRYSRLWRTAWNFFKVPYDSTIHRAPFIGFLQGLVGGRTEEAKKLGGLLAELLESTAESRSQFDFLRYHSLGMEGRSLRYITYWRSDWLRAFFADEPEWEERLRAWLDDLNVPED
jgi:hypothetical protein